jgi:hypothetical protein
VAGGTSYDRKRQSLWRKNPCERYVETERGGDYRIAAEYKSMPGTRCLLLAVKHWRNRRWAAAGERMS